ncbi:MAG: helix-turn-helix domain-containing protein [Chloroflexi bacterium]|nr:helix-turn-helix domain-containing protein [Chloroflexota bacterium]
MPITLAQLVREARTRAGMTQRELSQLVGTSMENVTSIENGRNKTPSSEILLGMSRYLDVEITEIYSAIGGTLNAYPWERSGELDLKDPELELMFRQVDRLKEGEAKERVKAFIRFTLEEDRRKRRHELEDKQK